jgi:hypothetical protein
MFVHVSNFICTYYLNICMYITLTYICKHIKHSYLCHIDIHMHHIKLLYICFNCIHTYYISIINYMQTTSILFFVSMIRLHTYKLHHVSICICLNDICAQLYTRMYVIRTHSHTHQTLLVFLPAKHLIFL